MNRFFIVLFFLFSGIAQSKDWQSHWSESGKTWYEKWDVTLNQMSIFSERERMDMLGTALQVGGLKNLTLDQKNIYTRAQAALLAMPGHAKYYQEKMEALRMEAMANEARPQAERRQMQEDGKWVGMGEYEDFREKAFPVLGLLPSWETVSVLGHYLTDPEEREPKGQSANLRRSYDVVPFPPNCASAYIAISNLGIDNPPAHLGKPERDSYFYDLKEVDAWKQWWNEVKTGKRTYRFKGSNIEYGPDGPATKEQLERIALHQRMESDRAERRGASTKASKTPGASPTEAEASRKPAAYAVIAAVTALLVSTAWYFRRKQRTIP